MGTNETAQSFFTRGPGVAMAWSGWLLAPLAAALQLNASYIMVPWACSSGQRGWLYAAAAAALLLATAGTVVSWVSWRKAGGGWPRPDASPVARAGFLAVVGLLFSLFAIAIVIAQSIPYFIVGPCQ